MPLDRDIASPPHGPGRILAHDNAPLHLLDHPGADDLASHLKSPGETRRTLIARGKRQAAHAAQLRHAAMRRAMAEAMKHPRDRHIEPPKRNPMYSQALGASGVNDGNQGKIHQGWVTNHAGGLSQDYPNMGTGHP
jgi:hypothetical protein